MAAFFCLVSQRGLLITKMFAIPIMALDLPAFGTEGQDSSVIITQRVSVGERYGSQSSLLVTIWTLNIRGALYLNLPLKQLGGTQHI